MDEVGCGGSAVDCASGTACLLLGCAIAVLEDCRIEDVAAVAPPDGDQAIRLAEFLKGLHQLSPEDYPHNAHRAGPLSDKSETTLQRITRFEAEGRFSPQIRTIWQDALAAESSGEPAYMIHGDMHPKNIILI